MKRFIVLIMFTLLVTASTACNQEVKKNVTEEKSGYRIYYLNNTRNDFVSERYTPHGKTTEELVSELLQKMRELPKNLSYKRALPDNVTIKETTLKKSELTINFDSSYSSLKGTDEILCRASIIKTLCQIEGIDHIGFFMNGQSIIDSSGKPVNPMSVDDIIDNSGVDNAIVTLFFSNKTGDKLLQTRVRVNYDGTIPLEQVIIDRLIQGPSTIEGIDQGKYFPTIPKGTELVKTTISKDGLCSVYFNKAFIQKLEGIKEKTQIYSVVNSLEKLNSVSKVKFYIEEESIKTFQDFKGFDKVFTRNLDIVSKK